MPKTAKQTQSTDHPRTSNNCVFRSNPYKGSATRFNECCCLSIKPLNASNRWLTGKQPASRPMRKGARRCSQPGRQPP